MVHDAYGSKSIPFYLLTLSLVAFSAYSQDDLVLGNEPTAIPEALISKPVVVNSSLNPTQVPVKSTETLNAQVVSSESEAQNRESQQTVFDSVKQAEEGVSTSANENSSGTQIIINNNQDQKSANGNENALENQNAGSDLLRRERLRQELKNEGRLLEKIEEGRITSELKRADVIEGVDFNTVGNANSNTANNLETAQVAAVAIDGNSNDVQIAQVANTSTLGLNETVATSSASSAPMFSTGSLSIIGGYRWIHEEFSDYDVQNLGYVGISLSTRIASFFGLEAMGGYGRDRLVSPYFSIYDPGYSDPYYYARSRDVFEVAANAKLGLLKGKFQPYILGGVGALHQRYNIDNVYTSMEADYAGWSRTTTKLVGNIGGGIDFSINKNLGFGVRYEYNYVFNKKYNPMDGLYGDSHDRMKVVGGLQINF
jgi:opacity protein-like surface antigen